MWWFWVYSSIQIEDIQMHIHEEMSTKETPLLLDANLKMLLFNSRLRYFTYFLLLVVFPW